MSEFLVRVYLEGESESDGRAAADIFATCLDGFASVTSILVERYWKIPENFGVLLIFETSAEDGEIVAFVTQKLGSGWQIVRSREAIWSHGETFVVPTVRWAHVEVQP